MSADVWIERRDWRGRLQTTGETLNITYNLSPMLKAAGFVGWNTLLRMKARKAGRHVLAVLDGMAKNPEKWRAKNPPNGWGDYDRCLQERMRAWANECLLASRHDTIGGWL